MTRRTASYSSNPIATRDCCYSARCSSMRRFDRSIDGAVGLNVMVVSGQAVEIENVTVLSRDSVGNAARVRSFPHRAGVGGAAMAAGIGGTRPGGCNFT